MFTGQTGDKNSINMSHPPITSCLFWISWKSGNNIDNWTWQEYAQCKRVLLASFLSISSFRAFTWANIWLISCCCCSNCVVICVKFSDAMYTPLLSRVAARSLRNRSISAVYSCNKKKALQYLGSSSSIVSLITRLWVGQSGDRFLAWGRD